MTGEFHEINAARLYCLTEGAGVPVVLLHGFGLDQRMWADQTTALARRFRAIQYDMRGYGRSSVPTTEPYSHADDLRGLLSRLGAGPAHVVGLSNGGRQALRFALAHPAEVLSLTLVSSALDGHIWSPEWQALWAAIDSRAKSGDVAEAKRLWLEHPLFAAARSRPAVAARLSAMVHEYSGWHWVHADPGVVAGAPAIERLGEIRVRTLIVEGERDLPDFRTVANTLAAGIAGASRVLANGVGHMANMEAPDKFNRDLLDFLLS